MSVNVSMGSGGVGASVSMHSVGSGVSGDELDKDEDEELEYDDDDEQDVDEINHTLLPKEAVRAHSPIRRTRGALVCQNLKRISKYNLSDWAITVDCTHIWSTETTIEWTSPQREDGISIFRKRREHNVRTQ
jgi:hypothetical protein